MNDHRNYRWDNIESSEVERWEKDPRTGHDLTRVRQMRMIIRTDNRQNPQLLLTGSPDQFRDLARQIDDALRPI